MNIEIFATNFKHYNENIDLYLSKIKGMRFEMSLEHCCGDIQIFYSIIEIDSLDKLEKYIYYLDWFGGRIRYKLVFGEDLDFIPLLHFK